MLEKCARFRRSRSPFCTMMNYKMKAYTVFEDFYMPF